MPEYRVVVEQPNGTLSFTQLLGDDRSKLAYMKKAKDMSGIVIDVKNIPIHDNQEDLRLNNNKIIIDPQPKMQRILDGARDARASRFTELDIESVRAMEDGDTDKLAEIKTKKQALRDLPDNLEKSLNKIIKTKKKSATKIKELNALRIPELDQ